MTTLTLAEAVDRFGVAVDDHLDLADPVPVLAGLQAQGDVAVIPAHAAHGPRFDPVPAAGVVVVSGDHDHTLLGDGPVGCARDVSAVQADVAMVDVPEGATAFLAHPEHGYLGLAPGRYIVRRQREQADEARLVAD